MKRTALAVAGAVLGVVLVTVAGFALFDHYANRDDNLAATSTMAGGTSSTGGATNPGSAVAPEPAAYAGMVGRGAQVYAANCFVCHGGDGNGKGPVAPNLSTPARDFTDSDWMSSQSDGVFFTSVLRGVPGTPMPSFAGRLSDADIWAAVAYIRGFSPEVKLDAVPGSPTHSDLQATLGRKVFEAQCAGCHGLQGLGDGKAAAAFPTKPRNLADGDWLSGRSDPQLVSTIEHGVPGTNMPAFYDQLNGPEIDAVVAYLRRLAQVEQKPNPLVGWSQETYLSYCASCHGVNGDGQGLAADRIDPVPRDFRNPAWMAGQTDAKLADAIRNGRPGTAMPPFAAVLSDAEIARLVEYIRAFAGPQAIPGADSAYRYDPATVSGTPAQPTGPTAKSGSKR